MNNLTTNNVIELEISGELNLLSTSSSIISNYLGAALRLDQSVNKEAALTRAAMEISNLRDIIHRIKAKVKKRSILINQLTLQGFIQELKRIADIPCIQANIKWDNVQHIENRDISLSMSIIEHVFSHCLFFLNDAIANSLTSNILISIDCSAQYMNISISSQVNDKMLNLKNINEENLLFCNQLISRLSGKIKISCQNYILKCELILPYQCKSIDHPPIQKSHQEDLNIL